MARLPLRDIAEKLTSAADPERVVDHALSYLEALQPDWRASIALRDPARDALVACWRREQGRLVRKDLSLPVSQLPARFVRKYLQPSAAFNGEDRRSIMARLFQTQPAYEADRSEAAQLNPIAPGSGWQSAVVLPLADQDDLIAVLVLASPRARAFTAAVVDDLQPMRHLTTLALSRRLHINGRPTPESRAQREQQQRMQAALQQQLREREAAIEAYEAHLEEMRLSSETMTRELTEFRRRAEVAEAGFSEVASKQDALEEQAAGAGEHLSEAFAQLAELQARLGDRERTLGFVREALSVLSAEEGPQDATRALVQWFGDQFEVGRVSVMRLDRGGSLRVHAACGMDPALAASAHVAVGQGVSGWVAQHRRPLLVRGRAQTAVPFTDPDSYENDSFVSVPLMHAGHLMGVLNLSNKRGGDTFTESDLERAELAGALLAATLARRTTSAPPVTRPRFEVRGAKARAA